MRDCGIKVCCGGIIGMGEQPIDRIDMLVTLANLPEYPESVPINQLIPIPGTPLAEADRIGSIEFVRVIALARIMMPTSHVRLSAGRSAMTDETQALCFLAGANSIFIGDTLLTADNPAEDKDMALLHRLGIEPDGWYPRAVTEVHSPGGRSKRIFALSSPSRSSPQAREE